MITICRDCDITALVSQGGSYTIFKNCYINFDKIAAVKEFKEDFDLYGHYTIIRNMNNDRLISYSTKRLIRN